MRVAFTFPRRATTHANPSDSKQQVPLFMAPPPAETPGFFANADGCLGLVKEGGAYYYATAPPCLLFQDKEYGYPSHGHGQKNHEDSHAGHNHFRTSYDRGTVVDVADLGPWIHASLFPSPRVGIALGMWLSFRRSEAQQLSAHATRPQHTQMASRYLVPLTILGNFTRASTPATGSLTPKRESTATLRRPTGPTSSGASDLD